MARLVLRLVLSGMVAAIATTLSAQSAPIVETGAPTLKIDARTVVVDVVVKDKKDQAVAGLKKDDFQVFENGKPQAITFFEPSFEQANEVPVSAPALPPNIFSNVPGAPQNHVTNILLLDALNTWPEDRMYAQARMVKYLTSLPPNLRIGIFTLTPEKLHMVWGLDRDSSALKSAIFQITSNGSSYSSPSTLVQLPAHHPAQEPEKAVSLDTTKQPAMETTDQPIAGDGDALRDFLKHGPGISFSHDQILTTMNALQAMAHYLRGIPGRKNLFWLVGDFPRCNKDSGYADLFIETKDKLAEAGVSVYPIGAGGVPNNIWAQDKIARQFIDSETWAEETGGKAYHANDIQQEIADAVDHGSRYYSLAYTPSDGKEEGRERKIEVRTLSGDYTLFYRKHYLEQSQKEVATASTALGKTPLLPLMGRGMPNISEILYDLKVVPSSEKPKEGSPRAGGNSQLTGKLMRYRVSFQLKADSLALVADVDGLHRKSLDLALMVYGQDGKPLNWQFGSIPLRIKPDQWVREQKEGIPFHIEIDVPVGNVFLRTGVYDPSLSKVGTLEVPLNAVSAAQR